jgi:hypothetical protein
MKVQDNTELYRRRGKDSAGWSRSVHEGARQCRPVQKDIEGQSWTERVSA